jgi:hypothetical protein
MYSLLSIVDILVLLFFLIALRAVRDYRRRGGLPYPPGPRPLPIVGNLFHVPTEFTWLAYTRLAKDYGMNDGLFHALFTIKLGRGCSLLSCPWTNYCRVEFHQGY